MPEIGIKEVYFLPDFMLKICISDGAEVFCDMRQKTETARFWDLRDEELFKKGEVMEGKSIRWSEGLEISLDELLTMCR